MAAKALKIKIGAKSYTLDVNADNFTLGELEFLETHFGLDDMRNYNWFQPKQMTGIAAIAVQREHPELDDDEILKIVRTGVKGGAFFDQVTKYLQEMQAEAAEKEADPQPAGANGTASAKAKPVKAAPAASGKQS